MISGIDSDRRVLLIGGSSLLGKYMLGTEVAANVVPTYFSNDVLDFGSYQMDMRDIAGIGNVFDRVRPYIVIICASIGSVDYCEMNPRHAVQVNVEGVRNILRIAKIYSCRVVYISSNAVFDGNSPPYAEDDVRQPVNMYGVVKCNAEDLVMDYEYDWRIIRPIMLYGWPFRGGRGNWVTRFVEFFKAGTPLRLVTDIIVQPTYARHCAEATWKLSLFDVKDRIFHIGGLDCLSVYDYAKAFCDVWGYGSQFESLVTPIVSSDLPEIATRPKNTCYNLGRMVSYGIMPMPLRDGLVGMYYYDEY